MDDSLKLKNGTITCKACQRKFGYILKHLSQDPECKDAYSNSEYEMLEKESRRITYKNKLIQERSNYNKEKRAKRYHDQKKEKEQRKMENHIKSEKQKICRQNESCKKEVTEYLLRQVRNSKAPKSDR